MAGKRLSASPARRTKCSTGSAALPNTAASSLRATPAIRERAPRGRVSRKSLIFSLRGDDVFELGLHPDGGETGGVPAAAEGFDEQDAGDQLLALDDGELLLVVEQILLRVDHIQITHEATGVPAVGDVQSTPSGVDGLLLRLLGLVQNG